MKAPLWPRSRGVFAAGNILCLLLAGALVLPSKSILPQIDVLPTTACEEFGMGAEGLDWDLAQCIDVWSRWVATLPIGLLRQYEDRDVLQGIAGDMRRRGSPCIVRTNATRDGAGSSTIRHVATWMFAREVGCDWITPDWGTRRVEGIAQSGATWYCHDKRAPEDPLDSMSGRKNEALNRCTMASWLHYFHLNVPSIERPSDGIIRTVQTKPLDSEELKDAVQEARARGLDNVPWDRLELNFHPMVASRFLLATGGWDAFKRGLARDVLREFRQNFHVFPRPWYDPNPGCAFAADALNFAIHVRLGDRRVTQEISVDYFVLLSTFMDNVTDIVEDMGLPAPTFHVFTETIKPCPSAVTGLFDELPLWPVVLDQVPPCLTARVPEDCPERGHGGECSPVRDGIFQLSGKPAKLHVGEDVASALTCMAKADGVLMGCSAFGQIAGLLTHGVSMFSTCCEGLRTPEQYKMIPPLAIAERGEKWVPVEGSWRNPRLTSTSIFRAALARHVKFKYRRWQVLPGCQ